MTELEIVALEMKLHPWARPRYAKEFAALRAGGLRLEGVRVHGSLKGARAGCQCPPCRTKMLETATGRPKSVIISLLHGEDE